MERKLLDEMKEVALSDNCDMAPQPASMEVTCGSNSKKRKTLTDLLSSVAPQPTRPISLEQRIAKELEIYNVNQDGCHLDSDPLQWWKCNENVYPHLSKLAKKYLCVTATSCSSERLFSISGNIVTKKRTQLKPNRVNELVFFSL